MTTQTSPRFHIAISLLFLLTDTQSGIAQSPSASELTAVTANANDSNWTGFRGSAGDSISMASRLPLSWSDAQVLWRATDGTIGQSSPVIWNNTVFVTSIDGPMKETLWVTALNLHDGTQYWRRSFQAAEQHEFNEYVAKAAPTPAVDHERLYTFFASGDLRSLDHLGNTVWHRNLSNEYGSFSGNHGVGSSLLLTPDAVVVFLARSSYSYLLAVDRDTGRTLWKSDRQAGVAWSTPALSPDGREIIVSASGQVEGFDIETGQQLWTFEGLSGNNVASPTVTENLVITGGLGVEANLAIKRDRSGTLDRSDIAWRASSTSNFASPFLYQHCVYWVNPAGAARCINPDTGETRWVHRLPGSIWATPLGHKDYVYFFTVNGTTQVLRASPEAVEVVSTNHLSVDGPVTGYAVSEDAIVIRAGREIIRLSSPRD